MDELIKLVTSKVGISEAQAKQAVDVVMEFLKDKLPEPFGSQVEAALKGDLGSITDALGGLFGKK